MKSNEKTQVFVLSNVSRLREFGTMTLCRMLIEHKGNLTCHVELGIPEGEECPIVLDITYDEEVSFGDFSHTHFRSFTSLLESLKGFKAKLADTEALQEKWDELETHYSIIRGETERMDFRSKTSAKLFSVDFYLCSKERQEFIQKSPHFELMYSDEENEAKFRSVTNDNQKSTIFDNPNSTIKGWAE